ncbi:hypothetical protein PSTT_11726 [Puccinia striiformis]|uniref:UBC core domain-containing protein n=1 Tax=Puccinia striiformis TaxID=27350 RepID=A0A2S4UZ51_9BASI|nr:hypothetical protein PSTT_11726 [Puccinia striiformis]
MFRLCLMDGRPKKYTWAHWTPRAGLPLSGEPGPRLNVISSHHTRLTTPTSTRTTTSTLSSFHPRNPLRYLGSDIDIMASNLPKRIIKETERLVSDAPPGISAVPHDDNLRYFDVGLQGPEGSAFQGGLFKLELFLPEDYPMSPPKVRFLTKIYHPNIDKLGRICLDILKGWSHRYTLDRWSPALQIRTVLLSIQALLSSPNPDDPLANDVAQHYKSDEAGAIELSREWTTKYAKP